MNRNPLFPFAVCLSLSTACAVTTAGAAIVNPDNGHWYEIVSAPGITWEAAKAAAETTYNGGSLCPGYLVTITTQEEQDFVVAAFGAGPLGTKWLGAFQAVDIDGVTGWAWVTGEPFVYTQWNAGEPNNGYYGPLLGYEDAANFWTGGKWNDAPSGWTSYGNGGYVVEFGCLQVEIDIKPGSYPNSLNNNGQGVIPVAILTTDTFDAATVDPASLSLDGQGVRIKGKSGQAGALEDVDGDGDLDLVVQFIDVAGTYQVGDTTGTVVGLTYDGGNIVGTDSIRIVPE